MHSAVDVVCCFCSKYVQFAIVRSSTHLPSFNLMIVEIDCTNLESHQTISVAIFISFYQIKNNRQHFKTTPLNFAVKRDYNMLLYKYAICYAFCSHKQDFESIEHILSKTANTLRIEFASKFKTKFYLMHSK